ncbi:MAG: 30S ribosomal protein S18 [Candidatus Doudnabacteria bacterium]|nr:30S ribosomal protein S18 [Candidatus Doudnabacteria bacterium]
MKKDTRKKRKQKPVRLNLPCPFNGNPDLIDYKDTYKLKKFVTTRGRLLPTSKTGVSTKCQRKLALSVKRARYMAMLPYVHYV